MIITGRRNVRNLLEYRNETTPESIFLVWGSEEINYRILNEKVNRLANGLLDLGVRKGDRVMIHLPNCPEFTYSFFALLKVGAVAVLSNINNLLEELCYTVSHSESILMITASEFYDLAQKVRLRVPSLRKIILSDGEEPSSGAISMGAILSQCPAELKGLDVSIDDDASILYTSGTSDRPKGVLYVQGNHVFAGELFSKQARLSPKDRYLCAIPLFHNNALMHQLLPAVTTGASMVLIKKFSASRFGDQIRKHDITIVTIPGALLKFILNTPPKPEDGENCLRAIFSGGNILTQEEYERLTRRFKVPIINWYGQTESVVCPLFLPVDGKRKESSIGLPALGYEVRTVDGNEEEVAPGKMGEIVARGLGKYWVMKEYYKDPGATAEALKNGWLHTGDIGYTDEEGYFYFAERKKEMIRVGGENVAAREVEMVLNQHPDINESAVIGGRDKSGNEVIKAFIVFREGKKATEQELQGYCSQKMAKFKIPRLFEFRTEFPRTAAGKIDKKTLRKTDRRNP